MAEVVFDKVEKAFGGLPAVRGIDLKVRPGEFVTLLGPSGCGKTTCLRMVAGFITPDKGRILMGGDDITALPPYRRNTGMVFQSYALFPHRTVADNIAFGLEVRRVPRAECGKRVAEALRLVRLEKFADRYPEQLSGGQKQRIALARAVVINPAVLLLDEPLAALDLKLREELQIEIRAIQSALRMTALFVTHDQSEALSMSDRVAVMHEGRIVQIDTPAAVYERPNSKYVANFVGRTNLIAVTVREKPDPSLCRVEMCAAPGSFFDVVCPVPADFAIGEKCLVGARPEHVHFGAERRNAMPVKVLNIAYFGSARHVDVEGPAAQPLTVLARAGDPVPAAGEQVTVSWRPESCFLLKQ